MCGARAAFLQARSLAAACRRGACCAARICLHGEAVRCVNRRTGGAGEPLERLRCVDRDSFTQGKLRNFLVRSCTVFCTCWLRKNIPLAHVHWHTLIICAVGYCGRWSISLKDFSYDSTIILIRQVKEVSCGLAKVVYILPREQIAYQIVCIIYRMVCWLQCNSPYPIGGFSKIALRQQFMRIRQPHWFPTRNPRSSTHSLPPNMIHHIHRFSYTRSAPLSLGHQYSRHIKLTFSF